uniref:Uncharacterized protein n=1 Tax=Meloidogyne hapla TaxID=6305 RepID=A0A1I8BB02_MELHA
MFNKLFFLILIFVLISVIIHIKANEENNPPQQNNKNSEGDPSLEQYLDYLKSLNFKNLKRVKREFYGRLPSYNQLNGFLDSITGFMPRHSYYPGPPGGGR